MKIQSIVSVILLGLAGSSYAFASAAQWPSAAVEENDPQVLAFYQARCDQWSNESQLQGEQREAFRANCLSSAGELWPVGRDESE